MLVKISSPHSNPLHQQTRNHTFTSPSSTQHGSFVTQWLPEYLVALPQQAGATPTPGWCTLHTSTPREDVPVDVRLVSGRMSEREAVEVSVSCRTEPPSRSCHKSTSKSRGQKILQLQFVCTLVSTSIHTNIHTHTHTHTHTQISLVTVVAMVGGVTWRPRPPSAHRHVIIDPRLVGPIASRERERGRRGEEGEWMRTMEERCVATTCMYLTCDKMFLSCAACVSTSTVLLCWG